LYINMITPYIIPGNGQGQKLQRVQNKVAAARMFLGQIFQDLEVLPDSHYALWSHNETII
jgi:hypothetical protein